MIALELGSQLRNPPPALFAPRGLTPEQIQTFLLEWSPLDGGLLPGAHLGEGMFACLLLEPGSHQVVIWDATADLGEQTLEVLAPTWLEFVNGMRRGTIDVRSALSALSSRRQAHQQDLREALGRFDAFVQVFHHEHRASHGGQSLNHHVKARLPRADEWRPQRLCVHDHLLGVMATRYDRVNDQIQVAAYATRDHTAYARGSATRGLLLHALCDWQRLGVSGGIAFLSQPGARGSPIPVPREIQILGSVLGVPIDARVPVLSPEQCSRLLVALSQFSHEGRRRIEEHPDAARLALLVHSGTWSRPELEGLLVHCPPELLPFIEGADGALQLQGRLWHAERALLAGRGLSIVRQAAESAAVPFISEHPLARLGRFPYVFCFTLAGPLALPATGAAGQEIALAAAQPACLAPLPLDLGDGAQEQELEELQEALSLLGETRTILILPRQQRSRKLQKLLEERATLAVIFAPDDRDALRQEALRRILRSARRST